MTYCKYEKCKERVFEDSDYCILHVKLPDEEKSVEFEKIIKLKERKVQKKIKSDDFNFRGAQLYEVNFDNLKIDATHKVTLNFFRAKVKKNINFTNSLVCGDIIFNKSDIRGDIFFRNNSITGEISFQNACSQHVNFSENEILSFIFFKDATINGNIILKDTKTFKLDFSGAKEIKKVEFENIEVFHSISFMNSNISKEVWFENVNVNHDLSFHNSKIDGHLFFKKIKILGSLRFDLATIDGSISVTEGYIGKNAIFLGIKKIIDVRFDAIKIGGHLNFANAKITRNVLLDDATIDGNVNFDKVIAGYNILLDNTNIGGQVKFIRSKIGQDLSFINAEIGGKAYLHTAKIEGNLNYKNTKFSRFEAQEEVSRVAKIRSDDLGDKTRADYYFYKEMEAKRNKKSWYFRYPEFLFQYCFGYGVYPLRVVSTFFSIFIIFTLIFWQTNGIYLNNSINYAGLQVSLKLSFLTMIIPAYGIVSPIAGDYGFYIIIEAILGAFMWPLFIAVFSRKYMR